jgi:hypothetical protein
MIRALRKLGLEGKYPNILKSIYDKPTADITQWRKTETKSPKIRNETSVLTIPTPIQHVLELPAREIRQDEEIIGIQIGKETDKISLFADDMILYLKDLKNSTLKHLDTINSYSMFTGYKINL